MKKLLAIGIALVVGLSACNPLDLLEPIRTPETGWKYVKTVLKSDKTVLLSSAMGDNTQTLALNGAYASGNALEIPWSVLSGQVFVENTYSNFTLKDMQGDFELTHSVWGGPFSLLGLGATPEFLPAGADYPNELILSYGGDDVARITWPSKEINLPDLNFSFEMPNYSGDITIEKIHNEDGSFRKIFDEASVAFVVKSYGIVTYPATQNPLYTAFVVNLLPPTQEEMKAAVDKYLTVEFGDPSPSPIRPLARSRIDLTAGIPELAEYLVSGTFAWTAGYTPPAGIRLHNTYVSYPSDYEGKLEISLTLDLGGLIVVKDFVIPIVPPKEP